MTIKQQYITGHSAWQKSYSVNIFGYCTIFFWQSGYYINWNALIDREKLHITKHYHTLLSKYRKSVEQSLMKVSLFRRNLRFGMKSIRYTLSLSSESNKNTIFFITQSSRKMSGSFWKKYNDNSSHPQWNCRMSCDFWKKRIQYLL